MESLSQFIQEATERQKKISKTVKNNEIFDFNHIPEKILIREEAKAIIENILSFQTLGTPNNMFIHGAKGTGKTLLAKYLAACKPLTESITIPIKFVNCRYHNTSFKILANILGIDAKGLGAPELYHGLLKAHDRLIIILDEIDLASRADKTTDILYYLSRAEKKYMIIMLSNSPAFYKRLDEPTKSSLQLERLHFRNYDALELSQILQHRCEEGLLKDISRQDIAKIAKLTKEESNGDARIAIKALQYLIAEKYEDITTSFTKAKLDILTELLANQTDETILILTAVQKSHDKLVKSVYATYCIICQEKNTKPYTYQHFYNQISYLQSAGLITIIATRQKSGNPNRIEPLYDSSLLSQIYQYRFNQ